MWKKYKIKELKPELIDVTGKRFDGQKTLLYELIDSDRFIVKSFFEGCLSQIAVINRVIVYIKYPLTAHGRPTDLHYFQAFRKWGWTCHKTFRNDFDYFQFASETAWLRMGDCEDSSILCAAGLELYKVPYFVAFGAVYRDYELLGYHAWVIAHLAKAWRLVETTLDEPFSSPYELPTINIHKNKWQIGDILYEAYILWNKEELWEWVEGSKMGEKLKEYLKKTHREKETKKKYRELSKSYMKLIGKGTKVK